jgi:hypothetical protein
MTNFLHFACTRSAKIRLTVTRPAQKSSSNPVRGER